MHNKHPETYCPMPFMAASLEAFDQALPCCVFRPNSHIMRKYHVHEFEDWWKTGLNELRDNLLNGVKHPGCEDCWQKEMKGQTSHRLMNIARYPEYKNLQQPLESPIFLMIGIGTHCNLKCIFCNPWKSSSVAQEYESRKIEFEKFGIKYQGYPGADWYLEDQALTTIKKHIPQAREIHFVGGEPLLKPVYLDILDTVKNPKDVQLMVNTSLERLSDRWIETLQRFRSSVHLSIEAAGPLNDYIRYGSTWNHIETNLERLKKAKINVKISHVLSRTSFWTLPGIVNLMRQYRISEIHFHYLTTPEALKTSGTPYHEREQLLALNFGGILGHPHATEIKKQIEHEPYDPVINEKFWKYIDFLDKIRNQNFRSLLHD